MDTYAIHICKFPAVMFEFVMLCIFTGGGKLRAFERNSYCCNSNLIPWRQIIQH